MRTADPAAGPLTPSLLRDIGLFDSFASGAPFDPHGCWENRYRVWSVTSLRPKGHTARETGLLTVGRRLDEHGGSELTIHSRILLEESNGYGGHNDVHVEVKCAGDSLSTPRRWRLVSTFHHEGAESTMLRSEETGAFDGSSLSREVNGVRYEYGVDDALTADWCVFDAVQRFADQGEARFRLFEGFNLLKGEQRLRRRQDLDERFDHASGPLRCLTQIGHGVLPCDYWLDGRGRLVAAIAGTRVCFLDDEAVERVEDRERNQHIYFGHGAWVPRRRRAG